MWNESSNILKYSYIRKQISFVNKIVIDQSCDDNLDHYLIVQSQVISPYCYNNKWEIYKAAYYLRRIIVGKEHVQERVNDFIIYFLERNTSIKKCTSMYL
ncbi:hypothetical protein ABPG73_003700 [Tetrahymena malaccensis]